MLAMRIGLLLALGVTLVLAQEEEPIKCPGGECVKLHLCNNGKIVTDGSNIIDIRFNQDEDVCPHYLLKCCQPPDSSEDQELDFEVPPASENQHGHPTDSSNGGTHPVDRGDDGLNGPGLNGPGSGGPGSHNGGLGSQTGGSESQTGGSGSHTGGSESQNGGLGSQTGGSGPQTGDLGSQTGGPGSPTGSWSGGPGTGVNEHATVSPIRMPPEMTGCGLRNKEGVGFRITGDADGESQYGEFPWMVAILREEKALDQVINVYQCGGSLIHPQVVLTAAHCVQNKKPHEIKVRLGEWDTQTTNEIIDHQDRNVVDIVVHEAYYKGGLFNDVGLVFLDKPADMVETVNTICLPPQSHNFDLSRCFASGWGKDVFGKEGKYQVILKKIELPIMPRDDCQKALRTTRLGVRFILNKSFICAGGEPGKDTCKGDGGSPLVCPIPGKVDRYYQAGIVAWGIGCGEIGIPGVYADVAGFRNWIDQQLDKRSIPHDAYIPK